MRLLADKTYHIYNRGNQKQQIFFSRDNYLFFLQKVRAYWLPYCNILCYCLMPNHFHFLIKPNEKTVELRPLKSEQPTGIIRWTNFSWGTRQILTSYAKAINKQEHLTGSLFTQNTNGKQVSSEWSWEDYTVGCFKYILQNPVRAGLVRRGADWEFSAWRDFAGLRKGTLCNMELARQELALDLTSFEELMGEPVPEEFYRKFY